MTVAATRTGVNAASAWRSRDASTPQRERANLEHGGGGAGSHPRHQIFAGLRFARIVGFAGSLECAHGLTWSGPPGLCALSNDLSRPT
jgi:hypothetical protein